MRTIIRNKTALAAALAVAIAATANAAPTKDSLVVRVTDPSGAPVIVNNGEASGTIQLFYTVTATHFTTGQFATFDLNWALNSNGVKPIDYGSGETFSLIQSQQGGYVDLLPTPASFILTGPGQAAASTITVFITPDKAGKLPSNADGTELVGNLKLDAGSKVGTVTNIQVHITLVHPLVTTCLRMLNFVTDQGFDIGVLTTTTLNVGKTGAKAGKVISSQPGQFSDNVLVVNTCATDQTFNLGINLDPSFETNPSGNPGNAVFTYSAAGEFDSSTFTAMMAQDGLPHQQTPCLENMTVAAGASFLVTVHADIRDNWLATSLPQGGSFSFTSRLYQNGLSGCVSPLSALAAPNPATVTLPFTIK